ncbi:MAG TPA: pilus assembly protein TadG-related protein [Pyrinomonadaceae bacterium]|nr:pilus assembly protein TadG-related protein [Pyrinomonadaceae bacterium]
MSFIKKSRSRVGRRGERGSVLAISTLGMLAFLLATGMCVDISHLYLVKTELQNAADAAALSAAASLNSDDGGITKATDIAVSSLNSYEFNKKGATVGRSDVRFAVNLRDFDTSADYNESGAKAVASSIRFVKVTVPAKPVNVFFASVVLGGSRNVGANAVAGMSVAPNYFERVLPVSVITDNDGDDILPGNMYTIRRAPGDDVTPGNYQILAIDGSGGSDDRTGLANGVHTFVGVGDYVGTKPGVTSGAVRQGINTRFGEYASHLDPVTYPPDVNVKEGITYQQYLDTQQPGGQSGANFQSPSHGTGEWGRRVVLIPIVKKSEFDNGRDSVQVFRIGAFFLRTSVGNGNGGDIQVEYIGLHTIVGAGGYNPNGGPGMTELAVPVLYR